MKLTLPMAALLSAVSVSATPVPDFISSLLGQGNCPLFGGCISQSQAELFVKRFSGILTKQGSDLGDYLTTADKLLAANFQEISGSVNSLAGFDLEGPTSSSKQAYIAGIQHAPADNGVNTLYVNVANCQNILWHWDIKGVGSGKYPVKVGWRSSQNCHLSTVVLMFELQGFNYFALDNKCQCSRLDLEFNSIAWGLDTGYGLQWPNGTIQH
ncbi:uncharacterized protein LTR77_009813 [Saxophila tyrrhenica]|uniref:NTF2-like domain-containing protein n=1 Tax=Saxophila tyrrhenica TaxID=1690608 RepID=A0AAV9NXD6_9PEZI|nr:hypothetical protein LTR77_009813 [Saxophila tyrrhenica]